MADSAYKIQMYGQMLKLDRRSRVFSLLAEELCAARQWEEAAEVCKKGLLFHPDHLRSRVLLAQALKELGEADQSEQILLHLAQDFLKNAHIFKLLSEFSTISGNMEKAGEYAWIYEAIQDPGALRVKMDLLKGIDNTGAVAASPLEDESIAWADFKAEAVEELQGINTDMETGSFAQPEPNAETSSAIDFKSILDCLARNIDERFGTKALPDPLFSEDDRKSLVGEIVYALSHA